MKLKKFLPKAQGGTETEMLDEVTVTASAMEPRVFGTGYQEQGEYNWNKDYTQYYLPINLNNAGGVSKNKFGDYVFNKPGRLARQVKREFKNQFGVNPRGIKSDFTKIFSEPFSSFNSVVPEGNNVAFSATRPSLSNNYYTNPYDDQLAPYSRPGEYHRGYISNDRDALLNTLNLKGTAKDFKSLFEYTHGYRPYLSANHQIDFGPDGGWRREEREFKKGMVDNAFIGEEEITTKGAFESNMINYLGSDAYFERLAGTQYADEIDIDKWSTDEAYRVGFANRLKSEKPQLVDQTYASLSKLVAKPISGNITKNLFHQAHADVSGNEYESGSVNYNPLSFNTPWGGPEGREKAFIKEIKRQLERGDITLEEAIIAEQYGPSGLNDNFSDVMAHEFGHIYSLGAKRSTLDNEASQIAPGLDKEYEFLWNMNQATKDVPFYSYQNHLNTGSKPISYPTALNYELKSAADRLDTEYHMISPEETKADVYGIRNYLLRTQGQDYDQPFTKENYESLMNDETFKEGLFYKRMKERYGDDQSSWMKAMNLIAAEDNPKDYSMYAEKGGQLPKAQEGIEVIGRNGVRKNSDGSVSTHLMAREYVDGRGWVAFPTLFQNPDSSWVDMSQDSSWYPAYEEAVKRGEVYDFGENVEAAINFSDKGSWKKQKGGQEGPPYMTEGPVSKLIYPSGNEGPEPPIDQLTQNIINSGEIKASGNNKELSVDIDRLKRGLKYAESLDGTLMMNPESTATGFYGQLFSEIEGKDFMKGITRKEFANDTTLQNRVFDERVAGNELFFGKPSGLAEDGMDLYNEYKPQLGDKLTYTPTELAALSNMLGRQGTRNYLGYVLRDGKSLAEALPDIYGPKAKYKNHTPEEYIAKWNQAFKEAGGESIPSYDDYDTFNRAWLAARKKLGPGKQFMYGGVVESTNT
jgi:hypothetical protein